MRLAGLPDKKFVPSIGITLLHCPEWDDGGAT